MAKRVPFGSPLAVRCVVELVPHDHRHECEQHRIDATQRLQVVSDVAARLTQGLDGRDRTKSDEADHAQGRRERDHRRQFQQRS
jgi:hypothetical protein